MTPGGRGDTGRPGVTGDEVERWAASGAMALTGRPDSPALGPPAGLVDHLDRLGDGLAQAAARVGGALAVEPLALLSERAAIAGLARAGTVSCGRGTRLLGAADGPVAVSLARPDDLDLIPAWLGVGPVEGGEAAWAAVAEAVAGEPTRTLVERASLLGLAVAGLDGADPGGSTDRVPVVTHHLGAAPPVGSLEAITVMDLSSLWAGPLAAGLLAEAGARVIKVESSARPDGGRAGPAGFFDLVNHRKASVALDLSSETGRRRLAELVALTDVVVEASRPRALAQLGIDANAALANGTRVWLSITGHGRTGPEANRAAYGDDAAVAGGLVVRDEAGPCFCSDAIADPLTGMVAACAVLKALAEPGAVLLDVALGAVAASFAGPTLPVSEDVPAEAPAARPADGSARALGADTDAVLAEFGIA